MGGLVRIFTGKAIQGPQNPSPKKGSKWCSVLSTGAIGKNQHSKSATFRDEISGGPFLSWPLCFTAATGGFQTVVRVLLRPLLRSRLPCTCRPHFGPPGPNWKKIWPKNGLWPHREIENGGKMGPIFQFFGHFPPYFLTYFWANFLQFFGPIFDQFFCHFLTFFPFFGHGVCFRAIGIATLTPLFVPQFYPPPLFYLKFTSF